jgi:Cdc6-like AAA superfamily ATPase
VNVKVHVYGKVGIGKNVLCNKLGEELEREAAKAVKRLLSVEEKIFINSVQNPRDKIMVFLMKAGIRRGELLKFNVEAAPKSKQNSRRDKDNVSQETGFRHYVVHVDPREI